jgi:predicted acyl esterase
VVGVRKVRAGRVIGFEGSYGFAQDLVTHGMIRVALGADGRPAAERVPPWDPGHAYSTLAPVERGVPVPLDIELHASATRFDRGDELHLVVRGSWFFPTNPLTGQFPARYLTGSNACCLVHTGPGTDSALHLLTGPPYP